MNRLLKLTAVVAVAGALAGGCGGKEGAAAPAKGAERFRFAPITRTDVVRNVTATGTVQPRNSPNGIPVGAQVNGRIVKMFVDYNSTVTNGQVLALIDPLVYAASYKSSLATLMSARAKLALAEKTFARKEQLFKQTLCSAADYDDALATRDMAQAAVMQGEAQTDKAKADLDYCTIRSPVNGIVIDRKVEEGETVVSSMNAVPVLTIAEDLRTVWIEATIPEADIGSIKVGQPVTFTADAYRRRFTGKVRQIRIAATTTSNVVTYPVIIEAENPDELLFPGMTATLSIETARAENAVAVAAAALRFRPNEADRAHLGELPRGRKLWFVGKDGRLEFQLVTEGVSDDSFTEVSAEGATLEGRQAVAGYATMASAPGGEKGDNPFMPKMPKHGTKGTAPEPKK